MVATNTVSGSHDESNCLRSQRAAITLRQCRDITALRPVCRRRQLRPASRRRGCRRPPSPHLLIAAAKGGCHVEVPAVGSQATYLDPKFLILMLNLF